MSNLNDTSNTFVMDRKTFESILWQFQSRKISILEVLGYGNYGRYMVELLNTPDGYNFGSNGQKRSSKLGHWVYFNWYAETESVTYLKETHTEVKAADGKTIVKTGDFDKQLEAIELLRYESGKPASYIENWRKAYRVAVALFLGTISQKNAESLFPNTAMLELAVKNWQEKTPEQLRAMFEQNQPAKEPTQKELLTSEAEELGISVPKSWAIKRIKAEIKAKTNTPKPEKREVHNPANDAMKEAFARAGVVVNGNGK